MNIPTSLQPLAVPLTQLQPYANNPRRGNITAIADSLEANGQYRPIVVNARTQQILAGNHTYAAAQRLGWPELAATYVDVDDEQAARIVLVDNRTNDTAEYDDQLLVDLLNTLPDLTGTGYDQGALQKLLDELEESEPAAALTDPDDVPDVPEKPVTQLGDLWELGPHRVLCGDSTVSENVDRLFDGQAPDLVLTDPPYCSGGFQESGKVTGGVGTRGTETIVNDALSTRGYMALTTKALTLSNAGIVYVFTDWRMWTTLFDVSESCGYRVRSMIVWDKESMGMGRGWRNQHELILCGIRATQSFDPHLSRGNVIAVKRVDNVLHATQKPVDLLTVILEVSDFARTVYDPFGGSGSTLIAAHQTGRTAKLMELMPGYVDVICKRYQEHAGEKPIRNGEPHDFIGITEAEF